MNILLYILSVILRSIFVTIGIVYDIIQIFKTSHFGRSFKYIDQKYHSLAVLVDIYGNVACPEFWNAIFFKKKPVHPFGVQGQTMSAVFGFAVLTDQNVFSKTGLFINNGLNYFWPDHTTNAAKKYIKNNPEFIL